MANISQNWLDKGVLDILLIFTYMYNKKRYSNQIAKALNLPNRTVSRKLDYASKQGLLKYIREGKNKLYYLDLNLEKTFQLLVILESYKALKFTSKDSKLASLLKKYDAELVFGSYAEFKEGNDVDVVFFNNQNITESIIHPQHTTKREFEKLLSKKDALAVEISNKHIILSDYDYFIRLFMEHYNE